MHKNKIFNKILKDTEFPIDDGVNPYLNIIKEDIHHLSTLRLSHTVQAHGLPLSR